MFLFNKYISYYCFQNYKLLSSFTIHFTIDSACSGLSFINHLKIRKFESIKGFILIQFPLIIILFHTCILVRRKIVTIYFTYELLAYQSLLPIIDISFQKFCTSLSWHIAHDPLHVVVASMLFNRIGFIDSF